jgi:hypothetical protein
MNGYLVTAAVLLIVISINHSLNGERFIVIPLLDSPNLPGLFGELGRSMFQRDPAFMRRVLRMSWHVTIVPWLGSAALLFEFAKHGVDGTAHTVLVALALVYLATAAIIFACSRGRHVSWLIFVAIALCAWFGATPAFA